MTATELHGSFAVKIDEIRCCLLPTFPKCGDRDPVSPTPPALCCQHFWMGSEWSLGQESISAFTLGRPSLSEAPSTGEPSQARTWMNSLGLPQGFSLTREKS